jgi:AraC-like DNA-binding protein
MLAYAAQRDLLPEKICDMAGIDWKQVNDEAMLFSPGQIGQLWLCMIEASQDPLLGLHFGESLQLSALGVIGEVIKTSATVGDALTLALAILPTITTAFKTAITHDKDTFSVTLLPSKTDWQTSVTSRQTLDLLMIFLIHELDGLLLKKIAPMQVHYWREIDNWQEYERVLRCKPSITAGINIITFDLTYWNERIITANYQLQQILLRDFVNIKVAMAGTLSLRSRVSDYLLRNGYLGVLSLGETAANFNMSVRTLQRRLKDEDISFDVLADQVRKSLATNYLRSGIYPVKEISWMLGYKDLGNFTRSFKRWTGMTPSTYLDKSTL